VAHAKATTNGQNITFINGDVLIYPLQPGGFDFVVAVATMHHLPLRAALKKFSDLLRPGGVLAIVGLYRIATPVDYAFSAAALPISWAIRSLRGQERVGAPTQEPTETLRSIRRESDSILPGAVLRRQFFFRYTMVWSKPVWSKPVWSKSV
jgi:SAM-dependent methyltransferase